MDIEITKLIVQVLISAGAAFLAAWLAAKRFRQDKWWQLKLEAYSELVEALHKMKWPPSEHFDAALERREINDEDSQELWDEFKKARRNVWRLAEGSSFLISSDVMKSVQEMERGLSDARNAHTWEEHLDEQYASVQKCLDRVKYIGAKELGIKGG